MYAPTATDMQPPYTFAPEEEERKKSPPLTDDVALQLVNVLLEMAWLVLLTVVLPETLLLLPMLL
jgi:hypothetical protein